MPSRVKNLWRRLLKHQTSHKCYFTCFCVYGSSRYQSLTFDLRFTRRSVAPVPSLTAAVTTVPLVCSEVIMEFPSTPLTRTWAWTHFNKISAPDISVDALVHLQTGTQLCHKSNSSLQSSRTMSPSGCSDFFLPFRDPERQSEKWKTDVNQHPPF